MNHVIVYVYRIGEFPYSFHQTWTANFKLYISLVMLFRAIELATIASFMIVITVLCICNAPVAKLQHKFQSKLMVAQDERFKATFEARVCEGAEVI
jgi:ATP-binding cassette, subfamily C (CFTR/MRP), member 2